MTTARNQNVLLLCVVLCISTGSLLRAAEKPIVVIAHRGVHHEAPENSLTSIKAAIKLGCDYVELDVRTTKDGQLVLMHDSTVDRTTTGSGKVKELTLADIRNLKFKGDWPDEKVPTFDEAIRLCRKRIRIYVDHKDGKPEHVIAALKQHEMVANVVVYGSVPTLQQYKKLQPKIWITPAHPQSIAGIQKLAATLKPETLNGHVGSWTPEQLAAAHAAGVEVWVDHSSPWDTAEGVQKSLTLGVDAIQTDNPEKVIQLLKDAGRR